ncbi:hypothetical protein BH10BAC5_BH10BAC5_24280 [soil metagenome]
MLKFTDIAIFLKKGDDLNKAHIVLLVNALVLIILGSISYITADVKSPTALIAPAVGIIMLLFVGSVKRGNMKSAHAAVILTLLIALALIIPVLRTGNIYAVIMMSVSLIAVIYYVTGFINRKKQLRIDSTQQP